MPAEEFKKWYEGLTKVSDKDLVLHLLMASICLPNVETAEQARDHVKRTWDEIEEATKKYHENIAKAKEQEDSTQHPEATS